MTTEKLELRYVPLPQAQRWEDNPKLHSTDRLIRSIETHGFGDPPKYDATLGALVYGNGRTEALERMRQEGKDPPRGIAVLEGGEWAIPVIFGVDAESRSAAVAWAIDHNNLTLFGGDLGFEDVVQIWTETGLQSVLEDNPGASDLLASLDSQDVDALLIGPDFDPVPADDQSRLDEKKQVTCPKCQHSFRP